MSKPSYDRADASALLDDRGYSGALIRGQNPALLFEKGVRERITESYYWKEQCFGLNAATLCDRAVELKFIGGTSGITGRPTPFLCLAFKMLQLVPEKRIVLEMLNFAGDEDDEDEGEGVKADEDHKTEPASPNGDTQNTQNTQNTPDLNAQGKLGSFKYLRCLAAFYIRLAWEPVAIYNTLEPLLTDYRKIKRRLKENFSLTYVDQFVDDLLTKERICATSLWKLPTRSHLEDLDLLEPRESPLGDEVDALDEEDERTREAEREAEREGSVRSERSVRSYRIALLLTHSRLYDEYKYATRFRTRSAQIRLDTLNSFYGAPADRALSHLHARHLRTLTLIIDNWPRGTDPTQTHLDPKHHLWQTISSLAASCIYTTPSLMHIHLALKHRNSPLPLSSPQPPLFPAPNFLLPLPRDYAAHLAPCNTMTRGFRLRQCVQAQRFVSMPGELHVAVARVGCYVYGRGAVERGVEWGIGEVDAVWPSSGMQGEGWMWVEEVGELGWFGVVLTQLRRVTILIPRPSKMQNPNVWNHAEGFATALKKVAPRITTIFVSLCDERRRPTSKMCVAGDDVGRKKVDQIGTESTRQLFQQQPKSPTNISLVYHGHGSYAECSALRYQYLDLQKRVPMDWRMHLLHRAGLYLYASDTQDPSPIEAKEFFNHWQYEEYSKKLRVCFRSDAVLSRIQGRERRMLDWEEEHIQQTSLKRKRDDN